MSTTTDPKQETNSTTRITKEIVNVTDASESEKIDNTDELIANFEERQSNQPDEVEEVIDELEDAPPQDPVEAFDVTSGARREALKKVSQVLERASKGGKLNGAQTRKALEGLATAVDCLNSLITSIMYDLVKVMQAVGGGEQNVLMTSARLSSLLVVLDEKEIVTNDELLAAYKDKIAPEVEKIMKPTAPGEEKEKEEPRMMTSATEED